MIDQVKVKIDFSFKNSLNKRKSEL